MHPILRRSFILILSTGYLQAQQAGLSGRVLDAWSKTPLGNVELLLEGSPHALRTGDAGTFEFHGLPEGDRILRIQLAGYGIKRIPIHLSPGLLDLGPVLLEREMQPEQTDPQISLAETGSGEDDGLTPTYGLLQAGRDIFLTRAAFDFSQAFFRIRGYDSRNAEVLLNGFPMNSLLDGRPQWNHWGGLNDVMRQQELFYGLQASDYSFGGLLGSTRISTNPSALRPGWRLSGSLSNRTYSGRMMATYVFDRGEPGLAYAVSASRRWAKEGQIQGSLYDAWSAFGSLQYRFNMHHSLTLTGLLARNRRGGAAALTEEVLALAGRRYNPYWGWQQGTQRNSRERSIREPMLQFQYEHEGERARVLVGAAYQWGKHSRGRLGYYNAPNPDPAYYRYLPGYAVNNPGGANFLNARMAADAFRRNPQLDWERLYHANNRGGNPGKAAYLLYDDVVQNHQLSLQAVANLEAGNQFMIDMGLHYRILSAAHYARISDLLGAGFHEDMDPFSNTRNDVEGSLEKEVGDRFGYHYRMEAAMLAPFLQLRYMAGNWEAFAAASFSGSSYQREGLFGNERFPGSAMGRGEKVSFSNPGFKGGIRYHLGGRHWWGLYGSVMASPPVVQNTYINPREHGAVVPGLLTEKSRGVEFRYDLRWPALNGRLGAFYTRTMDMTDVNFFFVDAGLGSDFVQEVITGLDQLYMGIELGLEYELSSSVKASAVASVGKYRYASDPEVAINFDTAAAEEDLINPEGTVALGPALLKGTPLAAGPQYAFALGLEYRDPSYWWIGGTANYLAEAYVQPATLARTASFRLDPESGQPFPGASPERIRELLQRKPMEPVYLLNLVGGKSWLRKGVYMSLFASVTNVFDSLFRSGGYEQSRNGNYGQWVQDHQSGTPSFGTKYWYGYGRSYFLNLAVSF